MTGWDGTFDGVVVVLPHGGEAEGGCGEACAGARKKEKGEDLGGTGVPGDAACAGARERGGGSGAERLEEGGCAREARKIWVAERGVEAAAVEEGGVLSMVPCWTERE
ncbi:hypothetical protein TRIUR3_32083 [Triticum urartu]|uniref:Uncharacterized protein n=1 Tax=Triticum urartu TaxID=4572 RepID=M7ZKM2_TRIUA|nr:hypothetical protein TRIUR3_32083 [Triticum urartu]